MGEKVKIIAGLAIFLGLVTFPFWYPWVARGGAPLPELEPPEEGMHCIEEADWMKAHHMDLLDQWRNEVVRDGVKEPYESLEFRGEKYERSLTKTCLKCHTMKSEDSPKRSCSQCHTYASVHPTCMNCHLEPEGD